MAIKFAVDIIKEIEKRGSITIPNGYVTGEAFEEWLYENDLLETKMKSCSEIFRVKTNHYENIFNECYGDAA